MNNVLSRDFMMKFMSVKPKADFVVGMFSPPLRSVPPIDDSLLQVSDPLTSAKRASGCTLRVCALQFSVVRVQAFSRECPSVVRMSLMEKDEKLKVMAERSADIPSHPGVGSSQASRGPTSRSPPGTFCSLYLLRFRTSARIRKLSSVLQHSQQQLQLTLQSVFLSLGPPSYRPVPDGTRISSGQRRLIRQVFPT